MQKIPREIWVYILEYKTKLERRERFVNALEYLKLNLKNPELICIMTDSLLPSPFETNFVPPITYSFKAGNMIYIDYTTLPQTGFTVNVMSVYFGDFNENNPTEVWLSKPWPLS